VGSHHFRGLFARHRDASPFAVAHTRRVLFAKSLDETDLPAVQVAIAGGYASVRPLEQRRTPPWAAHRRR
jgi:AraC family transcriptional regulator of adaptative response / DNA-3-methyladenine glycosylase II